MSKDPLVKTKKQQKEALLDKRGARHLFKKVALHLRKCPHCSKNKALLEAIDTIEIAEVEVRAGDRWNLA